MPLVVPHTTLQKTLLGDILSSSTETKSIYHVSPTRQHRICRFNSVTSRPTLNLTETVFFSKPFIGGNAVYK